MSKYFIFVGLVFLAACGIDPVEAPNEKVFPVELRYFEKQNYFLTSNKFFLWKKGMTSEQGDAAIRISREIDALDSEAIPWNRRKTELDKAIQPLSDQLTLLKRHRRYVQRYADRAQKTIEKQMELIEKLESDLKKELESAKPSPQKILELKEGISKAKGILSQAETEKKNHEGVLRKMDADKEALEEEQAPLLKELETVVENQLRIELEGRAKVDEITQVVDWYDNPPATVSIQFEGKSIHVSMTDWDLDDDKGARNFTSKPIEGEKQTIRRIKYETYGGVFEFDVLVFKENSDEMRETYHFKIARTKYDAKDGRIFFGGELTKTLYLPDGQFEERKGQVKLVDRSN